MSRAIVECSILQDSLDVSPLDLPTGPDSYPQTLAETPILLDAHNKIQGINIPQDTRAQLVENLLDSSAESDGEPQTHLPSNTSWLEARLDFANPLTFQVCGSLLSDAHNANMTRFSPASPSSPTRASSTQF